MIKTLEQAGLDNRGEVHAPGANESDTSSGSDLAIAPTQALSHDPYVVDDVKEWLDKSMKSGCMALDKKKWLDIITPDIIAYLDKLAVEGSLPTVQAVAVDPKYKWIWGLCMRLWRDHPVGIT